MEHSRIAVIVFFLVVCFPAGYARSPSKVMHNGNDARIEDFPFAAVVYWSRDYYCGGAIIDERHILTAAHCIMFDERVWHIRVPLSESVIIAGTDNTAKHTSGAVYEIADYIWHPKFNYTPFFHNDIGILKLDRSIEFNDRLQPVKLPTKEAPESGDAVTIGWEKYANDYVLKQLPMHIEGRAECLEDYPYSLPSQMCTRPDVGRGPCNGDSGNPLLLNGEVIGILSAGVSCDRGKALVYTHVYPYLDWIKEVIAG